MRQRSDPVLIRLLFLTLTGILVTQTLGRGSLSSALFTLTFPLTFLFWLAGAFRQIRLPNALVILILIASCMAVTVNALVTNTVVSLSYIKKLVMFWSTLALFGAVGAYRPDKADVRFVFRINTVLACFFLLLYLTQRTEMYRINGIVTIYLTFRFTNPNLAGAFLSAGAMVELIQCAGWRKGTARLAHAALAAVLIYFVFQTRSRNAQLALCFFLAVWLIVMLFPGKKPRMTGFMAVLTVLSPLLFALGYLLLVYHPGVQDVFSFLRAEGKDLDSRVTIWRFALEAFISSPVFGAYSQVSQGTGASQMHNSHLDILASYGGPVLAMVCLLLFLLLHGRGQPRRGRVHFLCQLGFGTMLLLGIGEAMLFSGGMGIHIFAAMLLMLSNYDFESGEGLL